MWLIIGLGPFKLTQRPTGESSRIRRIIQLVIVMTSDWRWALSDAHVHVSKIVFRVTMIVETLKFKIVSHERYKIWISAEHKANCAH